MQLKTKCVAIQRGPRSSVRLTTEGNPTVMLYDLEPDLADELERGAKYIVTIKPANESDLAPALQTVDPAEAGFPPHLAKAGAGGS